MASEGREHAVRILGPGSLNLIGLAREYVRLPFALPSQLLSRYLMSHVRRVMRIVEESEAILRARALSVRISPEEFIAEMEGFIKEGSPLPKIDPLRLKEIWARGEKRDLC